MGEWKVQYPTSPVFLIVYITTSYPYLQRIDVSFQKGIALATTFQMKVFNDGLPSDDIISVLLKIYSYQGEIRAKWIPAYYIII
jgi:hypothetical protein